MRLLEYDECLADVDSNCYTNQLEHRQAFHRRSISVPVPTVLGSYILSRREPQPSHSLHTPEEEEN